MNLRRIASLAALCLALAACSRTAEAPGAVAMSPEEFEKWEIALVEMRIEKNEAFADSAQSPLPAEVRAGFEGLNYYFPARELRFRTPFVAATGADTVRLTKRRGEIVPYLQRGVVSFRHDGAVHTLAVYGPVDTSQGDFLWLPFFDATSGRETYGGGRYLDLAPDADGMVDLDFNYAYNPLCDYNPDRYNCTLPPAGNTLSFPVAAGEKLFGAAH